MYMKWKSIINTLFFSILSFIPENVNATKFLNLKVLDKDYLIIHFRDGEVRYRDDGTRTKCLSRTYFYIRRRHPKGIRRKAQSHYGRKC